MDRIEVAPSRKWLTFVLLAGAVWWILALGLAVSAWTSSSWEARALATWLLLVVGGFTALVVARWKSLWLRVGPTEIRFGNRVIPRAEVRAIAIEPFAAAQAQFWLWVAVMAFTQALSRTVEFRAADGRSLLGTTDLYGSPQLEKLAEFLGVPLLGARRRN